MSDDKPICDHCPCPDVCLRLDAYCEWAARVPVEPIEIRHICDASRARRKGGEGTSSVPIYPTSMAMVSNLARSLWDWATSGFTMASDVEVGRRLEICSGCEHWDKEWRRCKICGCFTDAKIRLKTEHCPLPEPKW